MDDEVWNNTLQMKGGGGGQGTATGMNLHTNIKGVGHVADLFDLRDTAAGANIRLNNLDGILRYPVIFLKSPAR